MKNNQKAFSLVEIIVAIVIFLIGVASVYAIMQSTMNVNSYNRDYIIASNLAREQIELVRNIRDTNFSKIQAYNMLKPYSGDYTELFTAGEYYKISNDFNPSVTEPVYIEEATKNFDKTDLQNMDEFKVCRDKITNLYDYCSQIGSNALQTNFYKFIKVDEIKDKSDNPVNGFKVTSEVVWQGRTVHSFDIQAIFTDYKIF